MKAPHRSILASRRVSWALGLLAAGALLVLSACTPARSPTLAPTHPAMAEPTQTSAATAVQRPTLALPTPTIVADQGLDARRIPIFITTDMSTDDRVALLYLLSHPGVQVLGIGSADGVAHVEPGARNVLRLLALMGKEDIPVAVGSAEPLAGDHSFPSSWRSGADRPFGQSIPQATAGLLQESTAELLARVVNAHPGQVTVVLLGAHTDLALALRDDPGLAARIKGIFMMGGAVYVPGNIHAEYSAIANETAEWNLWLDYVAAAEVFTAGIPLSMVPLDATNQVPVDREYYNDFASRAGSPAAKAVAEFWGSSLSRESQFYIWDVVAAVAMMSPGLAEWQSLAIDIITEKPNHLGQTVVIADEPANARVCLSVDVPQLQRHLMTVLNY